MAVYTSLSKHICLSATYIDLMIYGSRTDKVWATSHHPVECVSGRHPARCQPVARNSCPIGSLPGPVQCISVPSQQSSVLKNLVYIWDIRFSSRYIAKRTPPLTTRLLSLSVGCMNEWMNMAERHIGNFEAWWLRHSTLKCDILKYILILVK